MQASSILVYVRNSVDNEEYLFHDKLTLHNIGLYGKES